MKPISQSAIRNGLLAGFLTILYTYILYFIDPKLMFNPLWAFIPYFLIFPVFMVVSAKTTRTEHGGFINMGDAFMSAFITGVIAVFLSTMFSFVLQTVIDPSLEQVAKEATTEMTVGMMEYFAGDEIDDEQMDAVLEGLDEADYAPNLKNTIVSFCAMAMFGAVPALIIGRVIRRKKDPYAVVDNEEIYR